MTQQSGKNFRAFIDHHQLDLSPSGIETLQVNITKLCNQTCVHCHVDASPRRREMMSNETIDACLEILKQHTSISTLDITGGAPELHPGFKRMVGLAREHGKKVMVRHNLTVTLDKHPLTGESMAYLPEYFAANQIHVISSLPCYEEPRTDKQRGAGVYKKSIESLQRLNKVGYGKNSSGLSLDLVYNPGGAFLPPNQEALERDYKRSLFEQFGIAFNALYAITNMPIHRFKVQLVQQKSYESYMELLINSFNPTAAKGIMCRNMISVSHDGKLFDCDFNQMLGMQIETEHQACHIRDFDVHKLLERKIAFDSHCFACTAGAGSSCGGEITS